MARGFLTEDELRKRGLAGFSEEDYAEWLRRSVERRKDIQAHEMELNRMIQEAETGRTGMREAGATERLGKELEFRKPEQTARIGEIGARTKETGARARETEFGLGLREELRPLTKDLISEVYRSELSDLRTPKRVPAPVPEPKLVSEVARPTKAKRRTLRPGVKKFLWGTGERTEWPGLLAPIRGWYNLGQWANYLAGRGYEYLYPRNK